MKGLRIAIIGATGLVGRTMLSVLEELDFPLDELLLAGSESSRGKQLSCLGQTWPVRRVDEVLASRPDVALFSSGSDVSKKWAYAFIERVCVDREYALRLKLIDCETTELIWTALGVGMDDSEFFREVSNALQAR